MLGMKLLFRKHLYMVVAIILIFMNVSCTNGERTTETDQKGPKAPQDFGETETKNPGENQEGDLNKDEDNSTTNRSKDENEEKVNDLLKGMSLQEKVGQLLMPDFRKWEGKNVTVMNEGIASMISDYHLGGIILFQENVVSRTQTRNMIKHFQSEANIPLMIGIDQEGGLITRIPFAPRMPGNMALGATGDRELARQVGVAIGSELRHLGIQVNFGPVIDINNNPDNPVIGVRSFGDDKREVAEMGVAYMQGLNDAGVAAVGKHFPGHGDVDLDSHYVLPSSEKTLPQLHDLELYPFQSLVDEGIQGIMTAHITFSQIDSKTVISKKDGLPIGLPATLSERLLTELLREEMDYEGVLFSDAMDMKAITDHFGPVEAALQSIEAGVDIILMPVDIERVYNGIVEAVESGRISEDRIDQSVKRILRLKHSVFFSQPSDHSELENMDVIKAIDVEQSVANSSITIVHNEGILPLEENEKEQIALVATNKSLLKSLENSVKSYHWRLESIELGKFENWSGRLSQGQKRQLANASKVIIVTNTATNEDRDIEKWQMKTIQDVIDQDIPTIVVTARNPYDIAVLQGVEAFIAQYDTGIASFQATSEVIFGKREAKGKLPVKLP
jgi:beta-N-acetylhexosaminidase